MPTDTPDTIADWQSCGLGICCAEDGHEGTCAQAAGWSHVEAICPVVSCREVLGYFEDEGGHAGQWWADKAITEHTEEHHD